MAGINKKLLILIATVTAVASLAGFVLPALAESPCDPLHINLERENLPPGVITGEPTLTTISDSCISADISPGDLAIDYLPLSFSFPLKHFTTHVKKNFSNDNPTTATVDVSTGPDDVISVHDYRNSSGYSVTITSGPFKSSMNELPLSGLHLVTTYPNTSDLESLDPTLKGMNTGGVEYADGSQGLQDLIAPAFTEGDLNLPDTYLNDGTSFDENNDNIPDVITLMETGTAHVMRASQALSFYLEIPPSQPAGTYEIMFTIDLIAGE